MIEPTTEFEAMALDHKRHQHCVACGGCIVDPEVVQTTKGLLVWCKGCFKKIEAALPADVPRPWSGGVIYA